MKSHNNIIKLSTPSHPPKGENRSKNRPCKRAFKRLKFEKLSDPDIAFPETLHEKKHPVNSKKVQSRINPKSTEKCGKTR
jgi:hypothetical protein